MFKNIKKRIASSYIYDEVIKVINNNENVINFTISLIKKLNIKKLNITLDYLSRNKFFNLKRIISIVVYNPETLEILSEINSELTNSNSKE